MHWATLKPSACLHSGPGGMDPGGAASWRVTAYISTRRESSQQVKLARPPQSISLSRMHNQLFTSRSLTLSAPLPASL